MNSNKLQGRPIANDSSVQSLSLTIADMHSHLIKNIQKEEDTSVFERFYSLLFSLHFLELSTQPGVTLERKSYFTMALQL